MVKVYDNGVEGNWSGIVWAGNSTIVPRDSPLCGWDNEFCSQTEAGHMIIIMAASVLGVLLLLAVTAGLLLRKLR